MTSSTPPRVLLQSLGCRLNEAELQSWAEGFRRRGFAIAAAGEPADLVVVNTCAVTAEAARKSRKMLRRARRASPRARVVVSGCLSALEGEALARQEGLDLVVANQDKDRLVEIAADSLGLPLLPDSASEPAALPLFARGRQRAFVKVQDGCRHACTFCVTTIARGAERSRPLDDVVSAVARLAAQGIGEVVLAGVHLGGYGRDRGTHLGHLIRALLARTEIPRIRLGSLEPWDLPDGFWGLFADPRLMPHLHLPMQSGADSVLKRMARRCKTATFARLAERGRAAVPGLNLTTDIIIGFPGETDAEWQETLGFVAAMGFGQVHAFGYSPRAGTRAAELPGRVDAETQRRRAHELAALETRLRRALLARQTGKRLEILLEARAPAGLPDGGFGYSPAYLPVSLGAQPAGARAGDIIPVDILGPDGRGDWLLAEPAAG